MVTNGLQQLGNGSFQTSCCPNEHGGVAPVHAHKKQHTSKAWNTSPGVYSFGSPAVQRSIQYWSDILWPRQAIRLCTWMLPMSLLGSLSTRAGASTTGTDFQWLFCVHAHPPWSEAWRCRTLLLQAVTSYTHLQLPAHVQQLLW